MPRMDRRGEHRPLLGVVAERAGVDRGVRRLQIERSVRQMLERGSALDHQGVSAGVEARYRHPGVGEVVQVAQQRGLRRNVEFVGNQPLVEAFLRTQHHPVLAKGDRGAVPVARPVADGDDRHWQIAQPIPPAGLRGSWAQGNPQPSLCKAQALLRRFCWWEITRAAAYRLRSVDLACPTRRWTCTSPWISASQDLARAWPTPS